MEPLFVAVVVFLALQRIAELALARRNARALAARGGRLVPGDMYGPIVVLHVAFFVALVGEAVSSPFAATGAWTAPFLVLFVVGQALRYWAILALGDRWTTRLWIVPGEAPVARGPYRFLRHPNYAGVALELAAVPLAFGCFATAALFSAGNAFLLSRRVGIEERALAEAAA